MIAICHMMHSMHYKKKFGCKSSSWMLSSTWGPLGPLFVYVSNGSIQNKMSQKEEKVETWGVSTKSHIVHNSKWIFFYMVAGVWIFQIQMIKIWLEFDDIWKIWCIIWLIYDWNSPSVSIKHDLGTVFVKVRGGGMSSKLSALQMFPI